jgi:DNA recombination protein RmuC
MQYLDTILIFTLGVAVGAVLVFVISQRARAGETDIRAETTRQLENAFKALSADVLRGNSEQFLQLARTELERGRIQTRVDLEKKEMAIEGLVGPIGEALAMYNEKLDQIERARVGMFAQLAQRLNDTNATSEQLRNETAALARALSSANVRGTWGEMQLRRVIEFSGMIEHCDFSEQCTIEGNDGRLRPDVIVRLPGERNVLIDAKTPSTEFLEAANTDDASARATACEALLDRLRFHVGLLSRKQYWDHLDCTPEFVVLFLPSDAFLGLALQSDPTFFEYCFTQNIVVATPTTLIAMLKAVAYAWKQDAIAKNAKEISDLGRELYDRAAKVGEHLRNVGNSLGRSVVAFNEAVRSLEGRFLPTARKFRDLGAAGTKTIPELRLIETIPTELASEELRTQPSEDEKVDPSSLALLRMTAGAAQ